jgi:hypothetical protein
MLDLAGWIIQDWNYGDVTIGDRLDAAVEFGFVDAPTLTQAQTPTVSHVNARIYDVPVFEPAVDSGWGRSSA